MSQRTTFQLAILGAAISAGWVGSGDAQAANLDIMDQSRTVRVSGSAIADETVTAALNVPFDEILTRSGPYSVGDATFNATSEAKQTSSFNTTGPTFTLTASGSTNISSDQGTLVGGSFIANAYSNLSIFFTLDAPAAFDITATYSAKFPPDSQVVVQLIRDGFGDVLAPPHVVTSGTDLPFDDAGILQAGDYEFSIAAQTQGESLNEGAAYGLTLNIAASPGDAGPVIPLPPAMWSMLTTGIGAAGMMWASARRRKSMRADR